MRKIFLGILVLSTLCVSAKNDLKLHYNKPAQFFEESLLLGNGTMGATVYGGVNQEKIELNDITLWTGEPDKGDYNTEGYKSIPAIRECLDREDYAGVTELQKKWQGHYSENYQPLGNLIITSLGADSKYVNYYRELNISDATALVTYGNVQGKMERDYFVSAPDSLLVMRLKATGNNKINVKLALESQLPNDVNAADGSIVLDGYAAYTSLPHYVTNDFKYDPNRGIHFRAIVKVLPKNGKLVATDNGLELRDCSEALILVADATSFNGFDKDPVKQGKDHKTLALAKINKAEKLGYKKLLERHTKDYKQYFDRLSLDLGTTDKKLSELSTDTQLLKYNDENTYNPELEALYMQYGRYLLISSSRTLGVPATLQGLWNRYLLPPWSSNYTTNINLEENYWGAELSNLSEMHNSLFAFLKNLSVTGSKTAKDYVGVNQGWCLGHNSDIWAMTCPVGKKTGDPMWANWIMGGAWLSTHIWERYMFTQDKEFLKQYYPILKGASDFCRNWMIEKNGELITSPSTSPENSFITDKGVRSATCYGATADLAIIRNCLTATRDAAEVLGVDEADNKVINDELAKLHPYKIGKKGSLQEWYYDWEDQDIYHRHISHLIGLYPGHHITVNETPDLVKACEKTLELRGDNTTGWSSGWRINLFARMHDGANAYHMLKKLLRYVSPDEYKGADKRSSGGTYPNMLDAHPPFQIDGNFGGSAGMLEMLIQSTTSEIELLPALPTEWKSGKLNGVCARGGYVLDFEWNNHKITKIKVYSKVGGKTTIKFNGNSKTVQLKTGETKTIKI